MENITKALLIAGAILIIVMLLSAVMIFWNNMSGYFTEKHEAKMVEQLVEFNNRFANYNGQTIRGNELISVINRIIDYNNYQSGIEGYDRVIITIDLKGHGNELKYNGETGSNAIFQGNISNETDDNEIKTVANTSNRLTTESGISGITDTRLQKMSAQIANIVDDNIGDSDEKSEYIRYRKELLKEILKYEVSDTDISKIKTATYQYYQFTQFKRAMFKCKGISYNQENGRVNKMEFEVVLGDDSKIKFD